VEDKQELVRVRLKDFINNTGTTQTFICKRLIIPKSILSLYINKKKELQTAHLYDLDVWLKNRGF
jgi:hypothetical protein